MGKSELFSHFAERFEVKRTQAREFFDELTTLAEKELKRSGEFVLPGMVKLVVPLMRTTRHPETLQRIHSLLSFQDEGRSSLQRCRAYETQSKRRNRWQSIKYREEGF